jgi:hypothetical protein
MENSNNPLVRFDNKKMFEIISNIPDLTEEDRHDLALRVASDDIEIRKGALEKITQSQIAHHDISVAMGEISMLNKEGIYIKTEQVVKTGSGTFKIEAKGGDTKLIIPVLAIIAIIFIAILVIMFWD